MEDLSRVDRYLIGEAWTSPELYANVERLCDFGSRFTGTESADQARDFIRTRFEAYGLDRVRLASFDFLGWTRGEARLRVLEPVHRILPSALSLVYSPNTPTEGLRASAVDVGMGTKAEFSTQAGKLQGQFVLVSTESPSHGRWVHRREKYGQAVTAGAAGFLFANHLPGMLAPTGSLRPGELAEIPAVGLSREDGFVVQRLLRDGPVILEMRVNNRTGPAQFSHVIGEVPGRHSDEIVVVGAHYDGHDISQGAVDDASGTALVIELARLFAALVGQLRRTIRFETYSAEELGVYGSTRYVQGMSDDEVAKVDFMLNLDGGALGPGRGLELQGLSELTDLFAGFGREMSYPLDLQPQVSPASDHFPYFLRGVPAISIFARRPPGLGRGFGHTAADTLDKVDQVELRESAMLFARLLLRLADFSGSIGCKRSADEVKQILVDNDLEEPLRAQGKWVF